MELEKMCFLRVNRRDVVTPREHEIAMTYEADRRRDPTPNNTCLAHANPRHLLA
jgi:hypothetical protein